MEFSLRLREESQGAPSFFGTVKMCVNVHIIKRKEVWGAHGTEEAEANGWRLISEAISRIPLRVNHFQSSIAPWWKQLDACSLPLPDWSFSTRVGSDIYGVLPCSRLRDWPLFPQLQLLLVASLKDWRVCLLKIILQGWEERREIGLQWLIRVRV